MNSVRISPVQHLLIIPALVDGVEIGVRKRPPADPIISDQSSVSRAHDILPNHLYAVICTQDHDVTW